MSSRVAGASLALIAAAVLAVSIATPAVLPGELALFSGHPTVDGHTRTTQKVHVGLYGAEVCNPGGDGTCSSREPVSTFRIAALSTLGATALLIATAVILAILTLRKSEGRHIAGKLVRFLSLLAIAGVGVLLLLEPDPKGTVPIGFGMGVYGGAVLCALLGSVLALRPPPPIKLRIAEAAVPVLRSLQTQRSGPVPRPQASQPGFGDDRRADFGEARSARESRAVPPSSADFAGASEPFAHPLGDNPAISPSSQLRPLYDASPQQGGTGGLLPIERPAMPSRPPTPISRAVLDEGGGPPAPPSPPPPPPPERPKPRTLPPPSFGARSKPPSVPLPPDAVRRDEVRHDALHRDGRPAAAPPSMVPPPDAPHVAAPPISPPLTPPPIVSHAVPPPIAPLTAAPLGGHASSPPIAPSPSAVAPVRTTPVPPPPPPPARTGAPPVFAPPVTAPSMPAPPMAVAPGPAPRTQVSFVPPMPDNDLPIAPPTAQIAPGRRAPPPEASNLFPRPETPLAPPPQPVPPPARSRRESQPPRPLRESQTPAPPAPRESQPARGAMRAAVPMPDRSGRSAAESRPPPAPARPPSPRPTISTPVVPPPALVPPTPAMPPIPTVPLIPEIQRLAENEVTITAADPTDRMAEDIDLDHPTIARVPIEITENTSKTTVSPGMPMPDEPDAEDTARPQELVGGARDTVPRDGEAATASARGAGGWLPVPTTLAGAAPPVPLVRDRTKLPITTAPTSLPPPRDSKQQTYGPSPACPQCESPMTWVEEHLRFYCKSCRMYF
jgi:hypothetical protein